MKSPLGIVAAGFIVSVGIAADEDSKAEMRKLEGTWKIVSFEMGGKKVDPGKGAPEKAVIKDGKLTFFAGGKALATVKDVQLEVDATKKPKQLNLVRGEKESLPCIYEVTAEELKLAMPMVSRDKKPQKQLPRPRSFESKDQPVLILIAKRSKA